jgi:hypothetical protein
MLCLRNEGKVTLLLVRRVAMEMLMSKKSSGDMGDVTAVILRDDGNSIVALVNVLVKTPCYVTVSGEVRYVPFPSAIQFIVFRRGERDHLFCVFFSVRKPPPCSWWRWWYLLESKLSVEESVDFSW